MKILYSSTIISSMEKCLPLSRTTRDVPYLAIILNSREMPLHIHSPLDLPVVFLCYSPAIIISTISFESPPRIIYTYSTFLFSICEWQASIHFEIIHIFIFNHFPIFIFLLCELGHLWISLSDIHSYYY